MYSAYASNGTSNNILNTVNVITGLSETSKLIEDSFA